jgi:phospholipid-binding lipoprotein MlaA
MTMAMDQLRTGCDTGGRRPAGARTGLGLAVAGLLAALVAGCATPPADPAARAEFEQINDPFEPGNRYFFELNRFLDIMVMRPSADTYRTIVPEYGRDRIHGILDNMGEPITVANLFLQARLHDAGVVIGRFLVNSTVGVGGMFDVATSLDLPSKHGDFGQTLYVWGMPEGPYLVLPLFGPSNIRDGIGTGVDSFGDPVGWSFSIPGYALENWVQAGATALDQRSRYIEALDSMEKSSIDFYAQMRSMARQHRTKELTGKSAPSTPAPDYDFPDEPAAKPVAKPAGK